MPPPDVSSTTVDAGVVEAIVGGYHSTPADVLGMHSVMLNGRECLVAHAFRPLEDAVSVLDAKSERSYPMERVHESGFFECVFTRRKNPFPYRLMLEGRDGSQHEIEDPYRFSGSISEFDIHLHGEGQLMRGYEKFGSHVRSVEGVTGVSFVVWAPNALRVSVIGPFNGWDNRVHAMQAVGGGLWELFLPNLPEGIDYKYAVRSSQAGYEVDKADPYGFYADTRPGTASRVWDIHRYEWQDQDWLASRPDRHALDQPMSVYEVHLGSWRRVPADDGFLSYRDLAHQLVDHVTQAGFTHVELMPITEHPFDGSWGYQTTGYFAPTSRFGTPDDFKYFVDYCHQHEIGVILDWVPAHFPKDGHGLAFFDGTHLYEHEDSLMGEHKEWGTKIFNFGRNEVRNFLLSSALFWVDHYHIDGLRVDAVASMLYLDYSRESGEWAPNRYGGRENLEAIDFLRRFNELLHQECPGALTIAEESTAWPMVTSPTYTGGLGFDLKWNMGWMNDTLEYFKNEPIHRTYHQNAITFSLMYAFTENFMLPFSHDEVVHLKRSMLDKMPGDLWQKFANLRLLYAYMFSHPGKKLLFMGSEFGQWQEWSEARSLDWHLLKWTDHQQLLAFVAELNRLYRMEQALHQRDFTWEGFQWIDFSHADYSIISYARHGSDPDQTIVVILNCTPVPRLGYRVGLPGLGHWRECLNSDWPHFGGSGVGNGEGVHAEEVAWQSASVSALVNLPPLGVVMLKR